MAADSVSSILARRGGGCGPDEGFGALVVMIDIVFDGGDQFDHIAKNPTP
jgi:hypothetical protein